MTIPHHDTAAATDWAIDGVLLDATGQSLDLSNATLTWTLIGPQGLPVLRDATITVAASSTLLIGTGRRWSLTRLQIFRKESGTT